MAPYVAETFSNDLKQLRRQTIVYLYLAVSSDVHFDSRHDGEALRITRDGRQQNVGSFFSRFQTPDEPAQFSQFMIGEFEQFLHVAANGGVTRFEFLIE